MTIQELREKTGLSQSKFAEYFGLPIRTVQEWEQGRRKPPDYIQKLLERIWNLETTSQQEVGSFLFGEMEVKIYGL